MGLPEYVSNVSPPTPHPFLYINSGAVICQIPTTFFLFLLHVKTAFTLSLEKTYRRRV